MWRTALARARGLRWGVSRPVSPLMITSEMPQTSVAITGMRQACARLYSLGYLPHATVKSRASEAAEGGESRLLACMVCTVRFL